MHSPSEWASVERIWHGFHDRLRSFLLARLRDSQSADDILQEVFLKVHRSIDSLRDDERLASWIFRITRNAVADHYRSRHDHLHEDDSVLADMTATEDAIAAEQRLAESVRDMVANLPARYRDALLLTEIEGLTQAEMAQRLGVSVSGGKSRVQRGREKLKELLLECCHVELDRHGGIADYEPRASCCRRRAKASRQSDGDEPAD